VLSAFQQRVAVILTALPEAEGFALAGGGALIVQSAVYRVTHDLDFFAQRADDVDALPPAFDAALGRAGLRTERIVANHGFARLAVHANDGDRTDVDLCVD